MKRKMNSRGFTLLEVLLVVVIISSFIYMGFGYMQQYSQELRVNRTVTQMQQIMNAAVAYYNNNGVWPAASSNLPTSQLASYLPTTSIVSPWDGTQYTLGTVQTLFTVSVTLPTMSNRAAILTYISGKLPLASVSGSTVTSYVSLPAQKLNNAKAINFAGLYHHGGCVPVPTCPNDVNGSAMTAQVFVAPASVSGVNDNNSSNSYPLSSFTAYATGGTNTSPPLCGTSTTTASADCTSGAGYMVSGTPGSNGNTVTKYWRVCLQVVTSSGDVASTRTDTNLNQLWGSNVTLTAFTRCSMTNEPAGSTFSVYGN